VPSVSLIDDLRHSILLGLAAQVGLKGLKFPAQSVEGSVRGSDPRVHLVFALHEHVRDLIQGYVSLLKNVHLRDGFSQIDGRWRLRGMRL
jgi:hypothetical protein